MSNIIHSGDSRVTEGSIYDIANRQMEKPENILANADVVVIFDRSGSMGGSKIDHAREALAQIQRRFQGRIVLCQFDSSAQFKFGGVPDDAGGSTNLSGALELCERFVGLGLRFYLISDGVPDSQAGALAVAARYTDPINTIFIGDDYDQHGRKFLEQLAYATRGLSAGHIDIAELEGKITLMLTTGMVEAAPSQAQEEQV